ncbi:VOC family protein [Undibacterium sp. Jales W-56]|uniref:VOC family protein n=1 Tax=Undibacterium sp. Jales W-56 TaxID=2897325 RepID=UPI0021CE2F69|nr:VOC family protein [Undibacterium sp. Jales W-56]MCU6432869.1 VOC family protein [Undibacterium sp. Jales W-56]
MHFQSIPVLRIFDEEKAKQFYVDFLGMSIDWEHRFEENFPIYMQLSRDNLVFHLSEHSGDCTPGSKVFVNTPDIDGLYKELSEKTYKYNKPGIEIAAWGDRTMTLTDPFSNKILFNEVKVSS